MKRILPLLAAAALGAAQPQAKGDVEWRAYGANLANTKYSPLAQITRGNVSTLQIAWRALLPDAQVLAANPALHTFLNEATPLMVDGTLYTITPLGQVIALDPLSGRIRWTHDPRVYDAGQPVNLGFVHRGVSYWSDV